MTLEAKQEAQKLTKQTPTNPKQKYQQMTKVEQLTLQALLDIQNQLQTQQTQINQLKEYIQTNLNPNEIKKVACEAVAETTFTVKDHEKFVAGVGRNFDGVAVYFEEIKTLIQETAKQTVRDTTAQLYTPTSKSMFS